MKNKGSEEFLPAGSTCQVFPDHHVPGLNRREIFDIPDLFHFCMSMISSTIAMDLWLDERSSGYWQGLHVRLLVAPRVMPQKKSHENFHPQYSVFYLRKK